MPAIDNAHALVIGIADYANIRRLPKVQDAEDLAAALVDPLLCGYDPKNVTVLLDQDATKEKLRSGFDALKDRCNSDSTVFLYFSGHGGQIREGANKGQYLLPVDVAYPGDDELAGTAISGAEFTGALNADQGQAADGRTRLLPCRRDRRAARPDRVGSGRERTFRRLPRPAQVRDRPRDHLRDPGQRPGVCSRRGEVRRVHRPLP